MLNLTNRSLAGTAALVATAITLVAATPVLAASPSVGVAYGDLKLGTDAGVDALNGRIRHAARLVCNEGGSAIQAATCRSRTIASAQAKIAMVASHGVELASR